MEKTMWNIQETHTEVANEKIQYYEDSNPLHVRLEM